MTNTPQSPFGAPHEGTNHLPPPPHANLHVAPDYLPTSLPEPNDSAGPGNDVGLLGLPLLFLRNLSIRNKMFFVALPPLLVVFLLSVIGVVDRRDEANEIGRVVDVVSFIDANSELAANIRKEAIYSSAFMSSQGNETFATELQTARAATDASVQKYRAALDAVKPAENNPRAETKLREFDTRLANLTTTRAGVDQLQLPVELANDQYFNTSAASDQLTGSLVQAVSSPDLIGDLTNVVNLSALQSAISGEASILTAAEIKGGFFTSSDQLCESVFAADCSSFSDAQEFRARVTSSKAVFEELASPEAKQDQRNATATEQYDVKARSLYTAARSTNAITPVTDAMADASVTRSATSQLSSLAALQGSTIEATKARAESIAGDAQRAVWLFAAAALAALVIAAAAAAYAAKATIEPLRRLTTAAKELADNKIPALVQRLRDPQQTAGSVDAYESTINDEFDSISVDSQDEIGQLAEAFRSIQDVTVNVAQQQNELLRKGIGDIFVNLARRNQVLLDRQIQFIEKMEAGEEDPDQLANLFKLDHLATRMRRNAESLLVLAGAEQGRGRRSRPAPISDVIRVGMGEVEDFQRVRIGSMDPVNVPGNVAVDLAHLLGELIENATQFSPPDSFVEIDGRHEPTGTYYMRIMDRGIGMDDAAINGANELLANPPFMGLEISRSLGFIVVGRLAARFGIRVMLAPNAGGGVIATVILPAETVIAMSNPMSNPMAHQPAPAPLPQPPRPQLPQMAQPPAQQMAPAPQQQVVAPQPPEPAPAQQPVQAPVQAPVPVTQTAQPAVPMPSLSDVPTTPEPVLVQEVNQPALPKRQPKTAPPPQPAPVEAGHAANAERTPEQVRSMLSRYQAGAQRGRSEAAAPTAKPPVTSTPPPQDAPPPQGAPVRTSARPTMGQSARSPEEVRETLMKYRSGITRGRQTK
jgi:signal transduction histidine kinase